MDQQIRRVELIKMLIEERTEYQGIGIPVSSKEQQRTAKTPQATYACINFGDCSCPDLIKDRAILIDKDISKVLEDLRT